MQFHACGQNSIEATFSRSIQVTKGPGISFMKDGLGDTCFVEVILDSGCIL